MIFTSFDYVFFFITVITSIYLLRKKSNRTKKTFLLVASYYFYAHWDYRFVLLMFFLSASNYQIGKMMECSQTQYNKRGWLTLSIVLNLAILFFFKYYNFFVESANYALKSIGVAFPYLEIILPVGISFITFEIMSYIIDIYRGDNKSANSFGDLALLVSFFPHLVAGPILKPSNFLKQLEQDIRISWRNVEIGIQVIMIGLIKKILIANRLAAFVDPVFLNPYDYDVLTIWFAVIGYALQIYCDFSGYTDIAIGSAKCLGLEIPQNFNMPYLSRSVSEFWHRWHISLSSWLRDYLYVSLGGNQKGQLRRYFNLIIVMLLGGLWHGASWNFVIWGGLHGLALTIQKIYTKYFDTIKIQSPVYMVATWAITFLFVCITWVFFRASDLPSALYILQKMFFLSSPQGISWYATSLLFSVLVVIASHYIGCKYAQFYFSLSTVKGLVIFFFLVFGLLFLAPANSSPFIYFQF